jgi:hypothetical protein
VACRRCAYATARPDRLIVHKRPSPTDPSGDGEMNMLQRARTLLMITTMLCALTALSAMA